MKYSIDRHIVINASLEDVLPQVENFKNWKNWSPWTIIEPDHKVSFEGQAGEINATMSWEGEIIGSGKMTLEEVSDTTFSYDLQFFKPFKSKAKTAFVIESLGDKETKVSWKMDSSMPWFLFFMVPMMKSWIEMDYDRGLKMLKAFSEDGKVNATTTNEGMAHFGGFSFIGIQKTSIMEDMPRDMGAAFAKLHKDLSKQGISAQHWITTYPKVDMKTKTFTYIAAASTEQLGDKDLGDGYTQGEVKSGDVLKISHKGSYQFMGNAWSMGMMYMRAKKIKGAGDPFEYYHNSPMNTEESDLLTDICFPVK